MLLTLPLTGREAELRELRQLMTAAIAGRGRLLLLSGEAGAGKTSLLNVLTSEASGVLVACGHSPGLQETPFLGPWNEISAALARQGFDTSGLPEPLGARPLGQWHPHAAAKLLADWLSGLGRPLLLILEDIHWADSSSLELLRLITPRLSSAPLLIVATYRTDEIHRQHPLWRQLPEMQRAGAARLALDRLPPAAVRALMEHALPPEAVTDAEVSHLWQRTAGNALFIRELLTEAVRTGLPPTQIEALPETIQQALDSRLDRLQPETRALLQTAAPIGDPFPFDLLARVGALSEDQLGPALEEALSRRVIRPAGGGGERFTFDHALIREALSGQLLPTQRRRLHRLIAEALLASGGLHPEAVAFHLSRAREPRAADYLIPIADQALRQGLLPKARQAYEQALELLPEGDGRRAEVHLKLGQSIRYADSQRANLHWEEAAREAGAAGRAAAVWAQTQALAFPLRGRPTPTVEQIRELIGEAETLMQDKDYLRLERDLYTCNAGYPRVIGELAGLLLATGRFAEATEVVTEMKTRTAPGSNPYPVIFYQIQLTYQEGRLEEQLDLLRRMAAAQRETRYYQNVVGWEQMVLEALLTCRADRPDEADAQAAQVARAVAVAQEMTGSPTLLSRSPLGRYQLLRGDWDGARQSLLEPLRHLGRAGGGLRPATARLQMAQGDPAGAVVTLAPLSPVSPEVEPGHNPWYMEIETQILRAHALLQLGEPARALAWLEAAGRWMAWRPILPFWPGLHLARAIYHRQAGERAAALAEAAEALRWALLLPDLPRQIEARRLLGQLQAEAGEATEAAAQLQTALELAERCRFPHEAALTRQLLAELVPEGTNQPLPDGLTQREAEIIRLVARGMTDKQVGAALFISPRTVDGHLRRIFAKIGASSRTVLGAYAARHGLDR